MKYFVECTHTYHTKLNSGIQRVVRNIVRSSASMDLADSVVPVVFEGDDFFAIDKEIPYPVAVPETSSRRGEYVRAGKELAKRAFRATRAVVARLVPYRPFVVFLYAPRTQWGLTRILTIPLRLVQRTAAAPPQREAITSEKGDILVLLDSSWHLDLWKAVDKHRKNGVRVAVVIYDLIPHSYPQYCVAALVDSFNKWVQQAVQRIDAVVAISETVADEFRRELPKIAGPQSRTPAVSYFWLGSELDGERAGTKPVKPEILRVGGSDVPTYVYVSTIEPRKNHQYALDAFDLLWKRGVKANFVIVGRIGWKVDALVDRVRKHEQFGKQLFMFNDVEDNELAYLYDNVRGLIFTSVTEGFGLPIVEGLQRGLPVFASDIPVFREIGRQGVTFVDLANPTALADAIEAHGVQGAPRLAAPVEWMTWRDSTAQLFSRIDTCLDERAAAKTSAAA
jgi:alpha-1,2-rhamnosyltransferase